MMEFIASSRGNKQLLILDGYVHSEHRRLANNVISWECINRRNMHSCIAKIKTMDGMEVGRLHDHTCVSDPVDETKKSNESPRQRNDGQDSRHLK